MSDEAAFLAALKANPADDTARLIYADWLDEHDEPAKAEYLRCVVTLAQREWDLATAPEAAPLLNLAAPLPEEWRASAGARFALVLSGYTDKLHTIKWLREITGDGLGEAKEASERLPHTVLACVPYESAVEARSRVGRPACVNTFIAPSVSGPIPIDATYDLVVRCSTYATHATRRTAARQEALRDARAALTQFLAAARKVPEAEAEPLAILEQDVPLASGLTLDEARTRRVSLNQLIPPYEPNRGWSMWIHRRHGHTPTNPE
ncbi:ribosomal protein L7/L12 [Frigoriglobus tundricola]|uniref:Large ribosomal subunit protein bL12 C-terminal domain-containing protein n=1 Tax=Frigoriglobus tundricola TaxID=2774151 RepID=A0A6M5Z758_9BACT|nr:ribosomal protein L7/L12 [Frigoriglobus tundricola]QJX01043.1 hypothetical protein FTUN_8681 [Frigoriglobus tundricola]